ncbi:MAG TPA: hypothetical protein DD635_05570 [Flavobacteriales bacterium]|nr:hypothetical protein [Flavobacteriales bacterium]|tara:strand:+ start:1596 stop:2507 length:912 start_codon:yes stop_codon:yes gene_type:complete
MKHTYALGFALTLAIGLQTNVTGQTVTNTIAEIQGELFSSPLVGLSVTTTGIITANNVTSATSGVIGYFIQDGEGPWNGIFVYDNTQAPEIGDEVIIEAEVAEFYDVTELTNISYFETISSGNDLPAPSIVTTGELASSEAYEGCLVQIVNAMCTNPDADYGEAIFDDGSGEVKTNDYMYLPEDGWIQDEYYSITGCIHYTFEEYKIEPRYSEDVIAGFINGIGEWLPAQELSLFPNPASASVQLGTTGAGSVIFIDALGREVIQEAIQESNPTLDISELLPGVYVVQFTSASGRWISKLVSR